jgi:hypothetical protein
LLRKVYKGEPASFLSLILSEIGHPVISPGYATSVKSAFTFVLNDFEGLPAFLPALALVFSGLSAIGAPLPISESLKKNYSLRPET